LLQHASKEKHGKTTRNDTMKFIEIPYLKDNSIRKAGNHVFFKKKSCDQSTGLIANGWLMALTV
jgi:hypothetical protein